MKYVIVPEIEKPWLIYSREHNMFWRPNSAGYTWEIEEAGRYTFEEAHSRCEDRDRQDDGGPSEIAVVAPEAIKAAPEWEPTDEQVEAGARELMRSRWERTQRIMTGRDNTDAKDKSLDDARAVLNTLKG